MEVKSYVLHETRKNWIAGLDRSIGVDRRSLFWRGRVGKVTSLLIRVDYWYVVGPWTSESNAEAEHAAEYEETDQRKRLCGPSKKGRCSRVALWLIVATGAGWSCDDMGISLLRRCIGLRMLDSATDGSGKATRCRVSGAERRGGRDAWRLDAFCATWFDRGSRPPSSRPARRGVRSARAFQSSR